MKYIWKNKKIILLLMALLGLQLIMLVYYNLTQLQNQADFDSSSGMIQLVEIWRQKTLLIKDWEYQTTVGWDIPLIFAVPLYGLTKNVFLSMGIVNICVLGTFLFLIFDILRRMKISFVNRLLVMLVITTPYTLGQLGYLPMLFTGTASYSIKLLISLFLIYFFVCLDTAKGESRICFRKLIPLFIVWGGLCILSGISSGIYMLICGIAPACLYLVLKALYKNSWSPLISWEGVLCLFGSAAFGVGILIAKLLNCPNVATAMTMQNVEGVVKNAANCFGAIWELFGAFSGEGITVMSIAGIAQLAAVVFTAFLLVIIVYYIVRGMQGKERRALVLFLLCIIVVNTCVLLVTNTSYSQSVFECRYHIVSMVPALLLFGTFFQDVIKKQKSGIRYVCLFLVIGISVGISVKQHAAYGEQLNASAIKREKLTSISTIAKENECNLIVALGEGRPLSLSDARVMRTCDFDIQVSTFEEYNHGVGWGASTKYFENTRHPGKLLCYIHEEDVEKQPDFILSKGSKIGQVDEYQLYVYEENVFDVYSGYPKTGKKSKDFMYTYGYITTGTINDRGYLETDEEGGLVCASIDYDSVPGTYDIRVLHEDMNGTRTGQQIGVVNLCLADGTVIESKPIKAGKTRTILRDFVLTEETGKTHLEIWTEASTKVLLKEVRFSKK